MSAYTRNKSDTHTGSMSFNMFSPAPGASSATKKEIFDSSVTRGTIQHLLEMKMRPKNNDDSVLVSTAAIHVFTVSNTIRGSIKLPVLYENKLLAERAKVNMLGWNNFPSNMVGGYHEGSDKIMLALYKLNEVLFDATVVYPSKIYNQEAQRYEYRDNAFMTFNLNHKNKHDKPFGDSGFCRSTVVNISEYFDKYTILQNESVLREYDFELWLFTMYFDFMSHIAQQFQT